MARILVIHASFDGQTERIAARIASVLGKAGHAVTLLDAGAPSAGREIALHDAVIAGGAVRMGKHKPSLRKLARDCAASLANRPNAFFSVSLSAGGPGARPDEARRHVDRFCAETGWLPRETAIFAGALPYRRYGALLRMLMRFIASRAGGETDTSRDHEYTDWPAVERFASSFATRLDIARAA